MSIKSKLPVADCVAIVGILGMLIWFCDGMILFGQIPFFRDLATYFYPIKYSVAQAFQAGSLPLWDKHMAAGFPLMAGLQSAVFYPPTWAFYLLRFFNAVRFAFVFHYVLAATGGYVLFRSWKSPPFVSVLGAVLFAFSGTMVSLTNLLNHFQSAVWLPWVVFFWERALRTRRWKDFVIFAIAGLCQLLAGSPEVFLFSIGLLMLDGFRIRAETHGPLYPLFVLLGAGLLIMGLGMVQLLPTAELILQSRRDQPIPAVEALAWSLQPSGLIGLLLPTLEADSSLSVGVRLLLTDGVPLFLSHYIGLIGLLGLCCWFKTARRGERLTMTVLVALSMVLAFGRYTPVYPFLFQWLPLFHVIRFPEKFFFVTFALLVFAIVRGITSVSNRNEFPICSLVASGAFIFWMVVYAILRTRLQPLENFLHWVKGGQPPDLVNPQTIAAILVALEKQIAISFALALLFFLNWRGLLRGSLFQPLIILTVFFDLSSANKPLHFLRHDNLITKVSRILDDPPADHGRLFYYPPGDNLHPSFMRVAGNPSSEKATEIALNNLLPNTGLLYGFEYFQDIDALGRRSYTDFLNFINALPVDDRGKLLRVLNVKYVVAFHALKVNGIHLVREFPEHYSALYEVSGSVPRAYIVGGTSSHRDPFDVLRRLSSKSFDPSKEVIVDAAVHLAPSGGQHGEVAITDYQDRKVNIHARLDSPGILVLTDSYYPGWKVFVDQQEKEILRANYLFRGVELTPGNHTVEFVYDPASFRIGLAISLITAVLVLAIPMSARLWRAGVIMQYRSAPAQIRSVGVR